MFNYSKQILPFLFHLKEKSLWKKKILNTEDTVQLLEVTWVRSIVKALGKAKWEKFNSGVFLLKQTNKTFKIEAKTFLLHLWSDKTISRMPATANCEIQEMFHSPRGPQFWLCQENFIKPTVLKNPMVFLVFPGSVFY